MNSGPLSNMHLVGLGYLHNQLMSRASATVLDVLFGKFTNSTHLEAMSIILRMLWSPNETMSTAIVDQMSVSTLVLGSFPYF